LPARIAVVDSNVLFSIELTDLFMTFSKRRLIQLRWSTTILNETRRNLLRHGRLSAVAVERRLAAMNSALPDAMARFPEESSRKLRVAASDRHVLALAIAVHADSIITLNTRDFSHDYCRSLGVAVKTPDDALTEILEDDRLGVTWALREIADRRRQPAVTVNDLLDRWDAQLPRFADLASSSIRE